MNPTDIPPPALASGPFRLETALREGLSRRDLIAEGYQNLVRDIYVAPGLADDPWARLAAVRLLVPRCVLSHDTAARLWRLPVPAVPRGAVRPVHVTVPPGGLPSRIAGVSAHECQLATTDVAVVGRDAGPGRPAMRLPVTTPLRCFLEVGAGWALADVVALGDAALRSHRVELMSLRESVSAASGRRGIVRARDAMRLLDPRAAGAQQSRLRVLLVCGGLPRPRCALDLYDGRGDWLACADLGWPDLRVIVVLDTAHGGSVERVRAEQRRRNRVVAAGWTVVVVDEADLVERPADVLARVHRALRERGWAAPAESPGTRAALAALSRPVRRRYLPPPPPRPGAHDLTVA